MAWREFRYIDRYAIKTYEKRSIIRVFAANILVIDSLGASNGEISIIDYSRHATGNKRDFWDELTDIGTFRRKVYKLHGTLQNTRRHFIFSTEKLLVKSV